MALREVKFVVECIEHESGWGQRPDGETLFDTEEAAKKFVQDENAKNNKPTTPGIYWTYHYKGPRVMD